MLDTMAATKPRKPAKKPPSLYAQVGEDARKREQKKLLLKTLRENGWNLRATGEALGMGTGATASVGVIRALNDVAPEEYAKAQADEKIVPGKRRGEK